MQVSHALAYSQYSPEAAAAVLGTQLELTKAAGIGELISNPVNADGTPHLGGEALRNALLGLGVGGIAGGVSEFSRPEKERNYGRILDKALLGTMLGGGGTLAWRQMVNSGNPAAPAAFQDHWNELVGGKPQSRMDKVRGEIAAAREQASNAGPGSNAVSDTAMSVAENKSLPWFVRGISADVADNDYARVGAAGLGGAMGAGAGAGAAALGQRVMRQLRRPDVAIARKAAIGANVLDTISGDGASVKLPQYPKPSRLGRTGSWLVRALAGLAGGYAGAELGHDLAHGN